MSWKKESARHSLAGKGIKTKFRRAKIKVERFIKKIPDGDPIEAVFEFSDDALSHLGLYRKAKKKIHKIDVRLGKKFEKKTGFQTDIGWAVGEESEKKKQTHTLF